MRRFFAKLRNLLLPGRAEKDLTREIDSHLTFLKRNIKIWADDPGLRSIIAASTPRRNVDVRTADRLETVPVRAVSPELFSQLGVGPSLGGTFSASNSAMLSYGAWQRVFRGRLDVVGTTLWIDNQPRTVIGVMPERFWFSAMDAPVWIPLDMSTLRPGDSLEVVVRRPGGVTAGSLTEKLRSGLEEYTGRLPQNERQLRVQVTPMRGTPIGDAIGTVIIVLIELSVLLTLLIACTNVAILVISQWTARDREIAIRESLGASRGRVVRLLLAESVLIAVSGGILGVCATFAMRGWMLANGPSEIAFYDFSIDPIVLLQTAGISIFMGLLAGIAPALYETRRLQTNPMRVIPSDRVRQRWRHALVVLEIGVTVGLLVVTGVLIRGYQRSVSDDLGFRTEPLLGVRVENNSDVRVVEVLDHLKSLPGVANAGAAAAVPLIGWADRLNVSARAKGSSSINAEQTLVSPDFFQTLNVPIRRGRTFTIEDSHSSPLVAIINELLAARLFPGRDPIGEYIWIKDVPHQIVGVVPNYKMFPLGRPSPGLFLAISQQAEAIRRIRFVVRATGDPAELARAVRSEIRSLGPDYAAEASTLNSVIQIIGEEILSSVNPMLPLIATGMLLTAAGIYGVLAFAITRRSKELAVRMAIGASRRDVLRLVTAHSFRLIGAGVLLGIGTTYGLSRLAQGIGGVFDSPGWQAFVIPMLIVIVVGTLATWIPSRRALKINPALLLRTE